jgi:NAD(P) transhydrogenase
VVDSDSVLSLTEVPDSMVVVGAGVTGMEYASMFAALGTRVTVVDARPSMLDFCDHEVVESLRFHLRDRSVSFRFEETVERVEVTGAGTVTSLASGKRIPTETVMYSAGRQGATSDLDLGAAGLSADRRGRISVDPCFRTEVPHIHAVGDVIGFPALAATSAEQGRLAGMHASDAQAGHITDLQPIGIYTIPEISYVGRTEDELTRSAVPYEVGLARYRELARGQIVGDSYGMLKLLVHAEDRTIVGVHLFGTGATDLVHINELRALGRLTAAEV